MQDYDITIKQEDGSLKELPIHVEGGGVEKKVVKSFTPDYNVTDDSQHNIQLGSITAEEIDQLTDGKALLVLAKIKTTDYNPSPYREYNVIENEIPILFTLENGVEYPSAMGSSVWAISNFSITNALNYLYFSINIDAPNNTVNCVLYITNKIPYKVKEVTLSVIK